MKKLTTNNLIVWKQTKCLFKSIAVSLLLLCIVDIVAGQNCNNTFTYIHHPFCGGDSIQFVGTGGPAQINGWNWYASPDFFSNTSTGWLVLTQSAPRLVELTTVDVNNCTAYSSMMVTPVISINNIYANLGQDTVICNGSYTLAPQVTGGTGPYTYQWEPSSEFTNPDQPTQVFSNVYDETYWVYVTDASGCQTLDTVNITAVNTLDYMDTVYACNSQTYLELAPGATSYQWSNGATTQGIVYSGTGQISGYGVYSNCVLYRFITVLPCNNNCTNTFTYQHNPYCFGDSILLVGTGGGQIVSWNWYSPDFGNFGNQPTVFLDMYGTLQQPTQVTLTTVDINNCTAATSFIIAPIITGVNVSAGSDTVICNGSYTVTPVVSGGAGNYTYQWQPSSFFNNPTQLTQTFNNIYNQTFWIYATDQNGCTSLDTVKITALADSQHDTILYLCNPTVMLTMPDGAFQYGWVNGPAGQQNYAVTAVGIYTGYSSFNCGTIINTYHVLPCSSSCTNVFTYQHNPWACGDSVLFIGSATGNPTSWNWDFGDGTYAYNSQPTIYHYYPPEMGVTHTVTLTTTSGVCTTSSSNQIVIQGGNPVIVNAGSDYTLCQAGSYQISATAGGGTSPYTYQWSPATGLSSTSIANPLAIVQGPITYTITVTDANGCSANDVIHLDYIHPINDTLYLCGSPVTLCQQDGATVYDWMGGELTQCITVSDTGHYWGVETFSGCPMVTNNFYVAPCTTETCFNDFNYQSNSWACGDSVLFNANASAQCFVYMWDFGDGSTFNSNLPSIYHYYTTGVYDVTLTTIDVNGCTSVMTQEITIADGFTVDVEAAYSNMNTELNMGMGGNVSTCYGNFYDTGGALGNYSNNANGSMTFYPYNDGDLAQLTFTSFSSEANHDFITIYNNSTTSGTILYGPASGNLSIGTITANFTGNANGALTVRFTSDASTVSTGWAATIACITPNSTSGPDSILACQGLAHLNAVTSAPGNYFYEWSPATGLSNPYIANPVASTVDNVNYTVTVTNVETGCVTTDHINVSSYTFSIDTFYLCSDSLTLDFGDGGSDYVWQFFTDTAGNNSFLDIYSQTLAVTEPGVYSGIAFYPQCGALTNVFTVVACQSDSVWPGDANADGQAHNMDLLTIGIGYGTNGLVRPNATINWQPEASPAWGQQLVSGVDYKHIDCNGDAVIDVDDTLAVIQNYGSIHSFNGIENRSDNDPMLYLTAPVDTVLTGSAVVIPVNLGTDTVPATDVYGIGFTVHYNPDLLQTNSMGISFNNSWFGVHGLNAISIRKNFHAQGMMDVALTRIDHQNISGHGTIGELNFITIDNLSGKETIYQTLELYITDVKLIRNDEGEVQLGIQNDSVVVTNLGNSVHELNSLEAAISIYPNPTKDVLNVAFESTVYSPQSTVEILNATGQLISTSNLTSNITHLDVSDLAAGIYFVRISTEQGIVSKRFAVIK